jgi:FkbM family methyltransferase
MVSARPATLDTSGSPAGNSLSRVAWFEMALPLIRRLPAARGRVTRFFMTRLFRTHRRIAVPLARGFDIVGSPLSLPMIMHIMVHRGWDEHVLTTCIDALAPDGVFYDIGANTGYFSIAAANRYRDARVIAFEPLPELAEDIGIASDANRLPGLRVLNLALSAENGEQTLYLPTQSVHASFVSREAVAAAVVVPTRRLDDLVDAGDIPPPTVVKLDVEGAEMLVLDGAEQTLRRHRPLICFECDVNSERFGHRPADMIARLQLLGYARFEALAPDGSRRPLDQAGCAHPGFGDFIAQA